MTYLVRRNQKNNASRVLAFIGVIIILICIGIHIMFPHFFPALVTGLARPFWTLNFSINSGSLKSRESLLNENQDLKRQLLENEITLQSTRMLQQENTELKSILGRTNKVSTSITATSSDTNATSTAQEISTSERLKENMILSAVLKRPPAMPYDELIIDIGTNDDIRSSNLVYAPGMVIIGRVADALSNTSKVILFSSAGETFEVLIGENHLSATAVGRGGGQYEIQLPRDASVKGGDYVIAPSLDNSLFGTINSVIINPAQPFMSALFAPPVNIYELRWVLVEKE